jgi:hypothetical protein
MNTGVREFMPTERSAFAQANTPWFCMITHGLRPPIQSPSAIATASSSVAQWMTRISGRSPLSRATCTDICT